MKRHRILYLILIVFFACKKEELSVAPSLEFVSLNPTEILELQDELILSLKYYDENGDLGDNTSGVSNLFIQDSRTNVVYEYRVKQLAPDNANIAIEGVLDIIIPPLVISDGSSSETGVFTIYMKDRAGNESNAIVSTAFTIKK